MLRIYYGDMESDNYIFNPDAYFDNTYLDEWIIDKTTVDMVRDVDRSEVVGAGIIESPFLGPIPPVRLSGGVKTLILMMMISIYSMHPSAAISVPPGFFASAERRI